MPAFTPAPRTRRFRALSIALAGGLLSGCTMIPKYTRPTPPLATTWPAYQNTANPRLQQAAYDIGWADFFTDARLKALIAIAIRENRDLRVAAASIEEAQGQYDIQHAGLFPTISASGAAIYQAPSSAAGLSFAPGLDKGKGERPYGDGHVFKYYQGGIGFSSYEVDLFGRIRSLSRESAEAALSKEANLRSLLISIVSQVATAYVSWLGDKEALDLAETTLATQQETLRLTRQKYDHGEANLLTVRQAETQAQQSAALQADSRRKLAQDENLITLLIGAPIPDNLPAAQPLGHQTLLADLPAGVPSDLLARRPDIVAAEHDLLSAQADIGAARAAFFPRITLTGNDGVSSLQVHKLFTTAATTWGLNPSLQIPLWTWGMNSGNLKASKARRNGKIASYEKTVQTAFKEVADALAAREAYLDEKKQTDDLVVSSADAFRLAKMRYDAGTDSYLTTLESQRSYLQSRQIQIMVDVSNYQNLITIYRALGGGWKEHTQPQQQTSVPVAQPQAAQAG